MKAKLLYLFVFIGTLSACTKDQFQTKPQLKLKDVKTSLIQTQGGTVGGIVEFDLEVTDAEGDIQGEIMIDKIFTGTNNCPGNTITNLRYPIPEFPSSQNQKVIVRVKISNIVLSGYLLITNKCNSFPDISYFNFAITDKAGNVSDTLRTDPITIPQ